MMMIMCTYQDIHPKGHHDHGNQEVCDRQGDNKVVSDRVQGPFAHHRHDDQHVAEQGQQREDKQQQRPIVVLDWRGGEERTKTKKGR